MTSSNSMQHGVVDQRPGDRDPLLLTAATAGRGTRRALSRRPDPLEHAPAPASSASLARPRRAPGAGASVTLSSTVRCGNRLNAWNTMPIRRRTASASTRGSVMSCRRARSRRRRRPRAGRRSAAASTCPSRTRRSATTHVVRGDVEVEVVEHDVGRRSVLRTPAHRAAAARSCDPPEPGRQVPAAAHDPVGEPGQRDREQRRTAARRPRTACS